MMHKYIYPNDETIDWLLKGDPSIVYQVHRDILKTNVNLKTFQNEISMSGWGKMLLDEQGDDGLWGGGIYSPKWISTHYTLMLMMRLGFPPEHPVPKIALMRYLDEKYYTDRGINIGVTSKVSDVCVTAMVLSMLCHFQIIDERMAGMLGYFKQTQLSDGGWNCNYNGGDHHSSVHTTLSVLDALERSKKFGFKSDVDLDDLIHAGLEFMLSHKLYKSHRTEEPMNASFTRFSFPPRWFFDVMKALDQFQMHNVKYDERLDDALELLCKKQKKSGKWTVQNKHAGRVYFDMEKTGSESRWNTLRALRILDKYSEVI